MKSEWGPEKGVNMPCAGEENLVPTYPPFVRLRWLYIPMFCQKLSDPTFPFFFFLSLWSSLFILEEISIATLFFPLSFHIFRFSGMHSRSETNQFISGVMPGKHSAIFIRNGVRGLLNFPFLFSFFSLGNVLFFSHC